MYLAAAQQQVAKWTDAIAFATVKDRIVQMAVLLVIEPIFEADFLDSSFGFRPGKSAHQAIDAIAGYRSALLLRAESEE